MIQFNKDTFNIVFLTFLYFLQSVPLGLIGSLPYILSSRSVSYAEQAVFSFAFWPFSLKLLWAPIVDSVYNKFIGKRKTWLIPVQYMIGLTLILVSDYVKELLDSKHCFSDGNSIQILTVIFFCLAFMAATQDVVVDGWALTMFSNTSLGSTCESTGGTAGWFVGNVLFLVIESADFSNKYIRPIFGFESQSYGVVTIKDFMIFFGTIYIATTTLIVLFKHENRQDDNYNQLDLFESYKLVWKIVNLKPIQLVMIVVFTLRLSFGTESMIYLKLVEAGVPKEKLGLLTIPLTPLQFVLPFLIGKTLKDQSPFKHFSLSVLLRSILILTFSLWVYITPWFKNSSNQLSFTYYALTILLEGIHSVAVYSSYMPLMYFFSSIADKNYGATYMTFFNTCNNLARSFTQTSTLYLANFLTLKYCRPETTTNTTSPISPSNHVTFNSTETNKCITDWEKENCIELGGKCAIYFDSYYVQTLLGFILSICWIIWIRKLLFKLENLPKSDWIVYENKIKLKSK